MHFDLRFDVQDKRANPPGFTSRRVAANGMIKFAGQRLRIGDGLRGLLVGVRQLDNHRIQVRFYDIDLGEVSISTEAA